MHKESNELKSVLLLCLVRFFMNQTLLTYTVDSSPRQWLKKKYTHEIKNAPSQISLTHCVIYKQFYSESCQEIETADEYSYVYLSVPRGKRKFFFPYLINRKEVIKLTTSYDIAPLSWSCINLVFIHLF